MKLHAIRYFIAIVESGGFRSAARQLFVSQSALTAAVRQLEEEFGAPLLVRASSGVVPTRFGRVFLERARFIDRESQRAREEIAQLRGHWEGSVSFATSPGVGVEIVPPALRAFRKDFPSISIRCIDGLYPAVLAHLRDGSIDFAVGPCEGGDLEPPFVSEPLFNSEVVVAARRDHPNAQATSLRELVDCEWIAWGTPRGPDTIVRVAFDAEGLPPPKIGMVCESFLALPGIVAETSMLGPVPRVMLKDTRYRDHLTIVPTRERLPSPTISVIRLDQPITPATETLIGWIRHFASKASRAPS